MESEATVDVQSFENWLIGACPRAAPSAKRTLQSRRRFVADIRRWPHVADDGGVRRGWRRERYELAVQGQADWDCGGIVQLHRSREESGVSPPGVGVLLVLGPSYLRAYLRETYVSSTGLFIFEDRFVDSGEGEVCTRTIDNDVCSFSCKRKGLIASGSSRSFRCQKIESSTRNANTPHCRWGGAVWEICIRSFPPEVMRLLLNFEKQYLSITILDASFRHTRSFKKLNPSVVKRKRHKNCFRLFFLRVECQMSNLWNLLISKR